MKEGFIQLGGQDKPEKIFHDSLPKANKTTLADMPKTVERKDSLHILKNYVFIR